MLGRIFDQHMHMVALAVAGQKHAIHGLGDFGEMPRQPRERLVVKYLASVFGDEDQMADQFGDGMTFVSKLREKHLTYPMQTNMWAA